MKPERHNQQALAQRILTKAGFKIGGERLAKYLDVTDVVLADWIAGKSVPPADVILKCVHVIDDPWPSGRGADASEVKPAAQ